ncbi:hypothetical protein C0966_16995 (plasmid) [Bacillus methanolicus]|uniref:DnaA N-terminal domain-containing protein n=1 Tax=Bacillus methanolicus TaxID=1471 RepID=UPI002380A972|nr:DnaA N-terminal domain-containing protein [Bacillus methanolicus]MDE3840964.1 hypothetical protein [Bacillus methanolicus]
MEEERRNLKGNKDHLEYFRAVETGSVEPRLKLLKEQNEENLITRLYYYPEHDRVKFTEEEVRKFSLDAYGENIPYIDGELTIFNNYLFDFWGYYLNAEGLALYGHLKRFAYGNKDWCFPNFELISLKMDKSRPTIHNYMELLERYGFAYKFNVLNRSRDGAEEGPIFKIRKKVPLLTESLIYGNPDIEIPEDAPAHIKKALKKEQKGLPERLRIEHEKYVKTMINNNETISLEKNIDFEEIYRQWQQFGEIIKSAKKSNNKPAKQVKHEKNMDESELMLLNILKSYVSSKISKPSFETWFKDVLLKKDQNSIIILAPNDFAREWLEERYEHLIKEALKEYDMEIETLTFEVI